MKQPIKQSEALSVVDPSLGERLSPLLVVAMQCCLVVAALLMLAALFSAASGPLLPVRVVALLFFGFYWLAVSLQRFVSGQTSVFVSLRVRKRLARLGMACIVLLCLLICIWLRFYVREYALFDLAWFQSLNADVSQVGQDVQMLGLALLLATIAWLNYRFIQEQSAALLVSKGGVLLCLLVGITLGKYALDSDPYPWQVLALVPLFFWSGLLAQALQKVSAKRRGSQSANPQTGSRQQERIIFQSMALLSLLALVTATLVLLFMHQVMPESPPHASRATPLTPIIHVTSHLPVPKSLPPVVTSQTLVLSQFELVISLLLGVVVAVFIIGLLYFSARLLLRYLRGAGRVRKIGSEERKNLWSWSLFLAQLYTFLLRRLAFLRRLEVLSKMDRMTGTHEPGPFVPHVHPIRKIYRAVLSRAAHTGHTRRCDETPYEFYTRLREREPRLEPELGIITEAYVLVRYGGKPLPATEVQRLQQSLSSLDHKWLVTDKH